MNCKEHRADGLSKMLNIKVTGALLGDSMVLTMLGPVMIFANIKCAMHVSHEACCAELVKIERRRSAGLSKLN